MTGVAQTGTVNQNIGLTYNNDFMVTGITYAGGTEAIAYDKDGLPVQVEDTNLTMLRGFSAP